MPSVLEFQIFKDPTECLSARHTRAASQEFAGIAIVHSDKASGKPTVPCDPTFHPSWIFAHQIDLRHAG